MINKYSRMIFRNEDDGSAGGGASLAATLLPPVGAEPKDPNDGADDEPSGSAGDPNPAPGSGSSPTPPATPQQVTLDPKAFADAIKAAGLGAQAPAVTQPEPNKPLTPEQLAEARKALNFWEPDDAFFTEFNNMETQKQAFMKLRDGLTQQLATMMQAYVQDQKGQIIQQVHPALAFVQQHEERQRMEAFDGKYPDLAKPELRPLMNFAADQLRKQGKTYNSQDELFADVAEGMAAVIRTQNPEFKLSAGGSNPPKKPNPNAIKPAPSGGGGGGGGNANTEAASGVPLAVKFLPKIR